MSEECPAEELFALLDDEYARTILTETSEQSLSAKALADACDASLPTVYRRIDRLCECELLEERTKFNDEGRHYGVYRATLTEATIELTDGQLQTAIETNTADPADRFTELWEDI